VLGVAGDLTPDKEDGAQDMTRTSKAQQNKTLEQRLREPADELGGNQKPSEHKRVVLGPVFLKYISDSFVSRRVELESELCNEESADFIPSIQRRERFVEPPTRLRGQYWTDRNSNGELDFAVRSSQMVEDFGGAGRLFTMTDAQGGHQ